MVNKHGKQAWQSKMVNKYDFRYVILLFLARPGDWGDWGDREGPQGAQGPQGLPGLPGPGLAKNSRNTYAPTVVSIS